MNENKVEGWKNCSACKKPINYGAKYYVCSVSSCNGQRTGYSFCSVSCFEVHLPAARHKEAGAVEKTAPNRTVVRPASDTGGMSTSAPKPTSVSNEVLIIASRLKDYIQAKSGYSTSASVMDVLSDHVRVICERAMDNARADGRKTVMDRDFDFLKNR